MEVKLEMKSGVQETEPRAHARSYCLGSALHAPFDDAKHMHLSGSCGLCLHLFVANHHNLVIMTATGTLFFPCGCLRCNAFSPPDAGLKASINLPIVYKFQ
jgi:hypothetical protein